MFCLPLHSELFDLIELAPKVDLATVIDQSRPYRLELAKTASLSSSSARLGYLYGALLSTAQWRDLPMILGVSVIRNLAMQL
jgi:hypothetical protein